MNLLFQHLYLINDAKFEQFVYIVVLYYASFFIISLSIAIAIRQAILNMN